MTDGIFMVVSASPMPIWAAWMLAPKSKLSRYFVSALWPYAVLAAGYAALLIAGALFGEASPDAGFDSLPAVMAIFDSEWSTLAGWCHYVVFDLFAARWMMNDAPEAGYVMLPILVLTLFFGPTGLLVYAIARPKLRS